MALASAREALATERYFDGVQIANSALEACAAELCSGEQLPPGVEALDILRLPETFFESCDAKAYRGEAG